VNDPPLSTRRIFAEFDPRLACVGPELSVNETPFNNCPALRGSASPLATVTVMNPAPTVKFAVALTAPSESVEPAGVVQVCAESDIAPAINGNHRSELTLMLN
jgi:hypothetical protein